MIELLPVSGALQCITVMNFVKHFTTEVVTKRDSIPYSTGAGCNGGLAARACGVTAPVLCTSAVLQVGFASWEKATE